MRRLVCEYYDGFSFGEFVRRHPDLRGAIPDLLIGDLFTDARDRVWAPMESLYPAGKVPIAPWFAGTPAEDVPDKENSFMVPKDGPRSRDEMTLVTTTAPPGVS